MDNLIDSLRFKPLSDLEKYKLNFKGLYALRVKSISSLPNLFKDELVSMDTTLIYIGKGERTLLERLNEECRGKSNGTFFRGIGALLSFKPEKGSLIGKENQNNYRFSKVNRDEIVDWMNENLNFNFVEINDNIEVIEKELIIKYCPVLNTKHNPKPSKKLKMLREVCRKYALLK